MMYSSAIITFVAAATVVVVCFSSAVVSASPASEACKDSKCYADALNADPTDREAWVGLANTIRAKESFTINGNEINSQIDAAASAIVLENTNATLWTTLAFFHRDSDAAAKVSVEGKEYTRLELLAKALALDPKLPKAWVVLSGALRTADREKQANLEQEDDAAAAAAALEPSTATINGETVTARQAVLRALEYSNIKDDPSSSSASGAWVELGDSLSSSKKEEVTVDGKVYDRRGCFEQAVRSSPNDFLAWHLLGMELMRPAAGTTRYAASEKFQFDEKTAYSARDCFAKSVNIEDGFPHAWARLGDMMNPDKADDVFEFGEGDNKKQMSKMDVYVKALEIDTGIATAWVSLAGILRDPSSTVTVSEKKYTAIECLQNGLNADPRIAIAWVLLAQRVKPLATAQVRGRSFERSELFLEAIALDTTIAAAWHGLGTTIEMGKTVTVRSHGKKKEVDTQYCFAKAVQLRNAISPYFISLSATMAPDDKLKLTLPQNPRDESSSKKETKEWTGLELLIRAIEMDPVKDVAAYGFLAQRMRASKLATIQLPAEGLAAMSLEKDTEVTPKQLFVYALSKLPNFGHFWFSLGGMLKKGESVDVAGKEYSQLDCLMKALEVTPSLAMGWVNLGMIMQQEKMDSADIGGKKHTVVDCYVRALDLKPELDRVWTMLVNAMQSDDESIKIRGKSITKKEIVSMMTKGAAEEK